MINLDDRILADLTEKELWLLIHLARRIKADRVCWPSNKRILEDTRWKDERTLAAVKKSLIEKGLLRQSTRTRDDGSQASNEYTILTNMIAVWMGANTLQETVAQNAPTPPHEMYPPQVQNVQGGEGHKMHPLEVLTSEVLTSEEENVVFDENDAASFPDETAANSGIENTSLTPAPRRRSGATPEQIEIIIAHLNERSGSKFRARTKPTQSAINARIEEGYSVEDFIKVIDCKAAQWKGDERMQGYLRPETLFRPSHFEAYLQEANRQAVNTTSSADPSHAAFLRYVEANYPALFRSPCRLFSLDEFRDYMGNLTLSGLPNVITTERRREHLLDIMSRLSRSENERKKYGSLWLAYLEEMRALLNGKTRRYEQPA